MSVALQELNYILAWFSRLHDYTQIHSSQTVYIAPWSPGDFDKCLWSKTVNFPTLPESPPTLTPRAILPLTTPPPLSAFLPPTPPLSQMLPLLPPPFSLVSTPCTPVL